MLSVDGFMKRSLNRQLRFGERYLEATEDMVDAELVEIETQDEWEAIKEVLSMKPVPVGPAELAIPDWIYREPRAA
jgi:hypothetical protein